MIIAFFKNRIFYALSCLLAALMMLSISGDGFAAKSDVAVHRLDAPESAPIYIPLGKAELVRIQGEVADVLVANPDIIDVVAVQADRLYVSGLQVGDTNIIALDSMGNIVKQVDIHVKYDLTAIQALVEDLFPDENVKVGSIHDQILLTGSVSNGGVAAKISNIVGHYVSDLQDESKSVDELISNLLEVRGEQQVTLKVKIIEAQRSVLKELGVETNVNDTFDPGDETVSDILGVRPFTSVTNNSGNAAGIAGAAGLAFADPVAATLRVFKDTGIDSLGTLGLFVSALEEQNLINVLAEPNLTTVSGEKAGFLAGGETPVPSGLDQRGNIVVEFRKFGVSLNFMPVVLSDKRISLQMDTEVSSINFENAIPTGTVQVPGFDVRRAQTTVELPSGGSIMIAGILQSEAVQGLKGLPGIKNTPVLGDLLSSDSFEREETELVVIVTPYLVEPYAEKEERPDPLPKRRNNPLAMNFENNVRRVFDIELDTDIFKGGQPYGYLLD